MSSSPPATAASSRVRVLVVTIVHDPEDARIRYRQIPTLQRVGMQITYAAPFSAFDRTVPEGVRGLDLPRARGLRRLSAIVAARRLIRRVGSQADVILLHDPDLLLAVAGLESRIGRVVWDVHEDTAAAIGMREWIPAVLRSPTQALVRQAERFAERRYVLLLAEHSYAERFSQHHPVVPNSNWIPSSSPSPPGKRRIVYLGSISEARGGREMITLARTLPEFEVVLIGSADAAMQPELEAANAAGDIAWLGFVPNDQAVQMLNGALAGLALLHDQPNYARSLPTKIAEYLAHGVPVISTPNQSSMELVQASGGGIVVPFDDIPAAARAVRELATDASRRTEMARSGYQYVDRHLNWHHDGHRFAQEIVRIGSSRKCGRLR